jgi:hypothetical protein
MNLGYARILATALALFFLSGCALYVRDEDWHHHRRYWHHSSIQQSEQSPVQLVAQNSGDSGEHDQVRR